MLALVALYGLETAITTAFRHDDRPHVVVYADDFVVLHPRRAGVERARQIADEWLSGIGSQLEASKTRIGHTLHAIDGRVGFDFLGFSIRHYPTGTTSREKTDASLARSSCSSNPVPKPSSVIIRRFGQRWVQLCQPRP